MLKPVTKAIIAVAGLGTRWGVSSKAISKEMIPVNGKPAIQYLVEELTSAGVTDIIMVTSEGKEDIERHFEELPSKQAELKSRGKDKLADEYMDLSRLARFYFTQQRDVVVGDKSYPGTGSALLSALKIVGDEPFFYLFGDDLWGGSKESRAKQVQDVYMKHGKSVLVLAEVADEEAVNYGVVGGTKVHENVLKVNVAVEKPKIDELPSRLVHVSGGILSSEFWKYLIAQEPSSRNEIDMFEAVGRLVKNEEVYGLIAKGQWRDVGTPLNARIAELKYWLDEGEQAKKDVQSILNEY